MKPLTIGGPVLLLLCAAGAPAEAQAVASTFDQLTVLVKPGDKIYQKPVASKVGISPLLRPGRQAVAVSVKF